MSNFADRLFEAVKTKKSPLCVGLDPRVGNIPEHIKKLAMDMHGPNMLKATEEALFLFSRGIIDAIADIVPVVKPNIAFFEKYGPAGYNAYMRTVKYAHDAGLIVFGDVKRGDITSTSKHYADEFLGRVALIDGSEFSLYDGAIDAITINAYFGEDSTQPFLDYCDSDHGRGAILLCKTSNPSSEQIQDVFVGGDDGCTVCEMVADLVKEWGKKYKGGSGYSSVAAVVGATSEMQGKLRGRMDETPFLVPGYGAQGGGAEGVVPSFGKNGLGAVVNSSRGIIFAYEKDDYKDYGPRRYAEASRKAAIAATEDIVGALRKHGKAGVFE